MNNNFKCDECECECEWKGEGVGEGEEDDVEEIITAYESCDDEKEKETETENCATCNLPCIGAGISFCNARCEEMFSKMQISKTIDDNKEEN